MQPLFIFFTLTQPMDISQEYFAIFDENRQGSGARRFLWNGKE